MIKSDVLSNKILSVYNNVNLQYKRNYIEENKKEIDNKLSIISDSLEYLSGHAASIITKEYCNSIEVLKQKLISIGEIIDDKIIVFIINDTNCSYDSVIKLGNFMNENKQSSDVVYMYKEKDLASTISEKISESVGSYKRIDDFIYGNDYHKADCFIYMINVQAYYKDRIKYLECLNNEMQQLCGLSKNNIIGIINSEDLIDIISNEESVEGITGNLKEELTDKFCEIIDVFQDDNEMTLLKNTISSRFLNNKTSTKYYSLNKNINLVLSQYNTVSKNYITTIDTKKSDRDRVETEINKEAEEIKKSIELSLGTLLENYLERVSTNINTNIYNLTKGKGKEYILDAMYEIAYLQECLNEFTDIKIGVINETYPKWLEDACLSQYNYIKASREQVHKYNVKINITEDIDIDNIYIYYPDEKDGLKSIFKNFGGKAKFTINKDKNIETLNKTIQKKCDEIKNLYINKINTIIEECVRECIKELDSSFKDLLFEINKLDEVKSNVSNSIENIMKENNELKISIKGYSLALG